MSETITPGPEVLIQMRRMLRLPQAEVARRTGIDFWQLNRWENRHLELAPEKVQALADLIHQVSLERSEAGTLPSANDVSADSRQRGKNFRQQRLAWGIWQQDVAKAAGLPRNLVSMWENGYCEMDSAEEKRLNKSLLRLKDRQDSQLNRYLATLKAEQDGNGRTSPLKAYLSPPVVRMEPTSEIPPHAEKDKIIDVQRKIIAEQKKIIAIGEEQYRISEEDRTLLSNVVRELETKARKLVPRIPPSDERDQLTAIIERCHDVINE